MNIHPSAPFTHYICQKLVIFLVRRRHSGIIGDLKPVADIQCDAVYIAEAAYFLNFI
jgi:hypothetical protein